MGEIDAVPFGHMDQSVGRPSDDAVRGCTELEPAWFDRLICDDLQELGDESRLTINHADVAKHDPRFGIEPEGVIQTAQGHGQHPWPDQKVARSGLSIETPAP